MPLTIWAEMRDGSRRATTVEDYKRVVLAVTDSVDEFLVGTGEQTPFPIRVNIGRHGKEAKDGNKKRLHRI